MTLTTAVAAGLVGGAVCCACQPKFVRLVAMSAQRALRSAWSAWCWPARLKGVFGELVRTDGEVVRTDGEVVRTDGEVVRTDDDVVRTDSEVPPTLRFLFAETWLELCEA